MPNYVVLAKNLTEHTIKTYIFSKQHVFLLNAKNRLLGLYPNFFCGHLQDLLQLSDVTDKNKGPGPRAVYKGEIWHCGEQEKANEERAFRKCA